MYKRYTRGGGPSRFRGKRFNREKSKNNNNNRFGSFSDHSVFINKAISNNEKEEAFKPKRLFGDFKIDKRLKKSILAKGYQTPTPIQDEAIPHVLLSKDVVGIANTGTGKTGAFLIPLINKALLNKNERVLIMVPTRELAIQIVNEFRVFTRNLNIYAAVCVGGVNIRPQINDLRKQPQFVIGTPGRLKDLLDRKALNLSGFESVVLDEADRMLDMGFIKDMRLIIGLLPKKRQTLFFSATLSQDIERLVSEFLKDPVRIKVATRETSKNIEQDIIRVPRGIDKIEILKDLLSKPDFNKVLVFGRTKHGVDKLSKKLCQQGFKAESIHGNKTQGKRQRALTMFKQDRVRVLVATDVAARGLDITDVSHVINYDLPATKEDYIHRIGRTGRAGKRGMALTFVE